jgi:hypothetical protein
MNAPLPDEPVMHVQRYKHEFQKASGSREMVEHDEGDWVQYEAVKGVLAYIDGYLMEHVHMLESQGVHPTIRGAITDLRNDMERV